MNYFCFVNRLSAPPETLDQLGESLSLLEQLQQDLSNIEAKFPPLHQQFAILEKYEVAIPEEVRSSKFVKSIVISKLCIFTAHKVVYYQMNMLIS